MGLLTPQEKFDRENKERNLAWKLLKTIPEYKKDFQKSRDCSITESEIETIKNKWGFWPLSDPDDENGNFEFLCFFSAYTPAVSRFISPIDWKGFEYFSSADGILYDPDGDQCGTISDIDTIINISVDLKTPLRVLVREFETNIKNFQRMLECGENNTKTHDHLEYLSGCLKRAGLKNKEIIERLIPHNLKDAKYDDEVKKAKISEIRRALKKYEKVST